jgi:serine/threonine-protein kinase
MGIVYEGYDAEIDRRVAIKTIRSAGFDSTQLEELVVRLRREARAAGRLHHTNIVAMYEWGQESTPESDGSVTNTPFIAMEFVEGRELRSFFDSRESLPLPEIRRIMLELLSALEYAHSSGVVHRDIKPSNIVLTKDGTVKLADFGIARVESSTKLTEMGSFIGTPCYMPPEQLKGETVDQRADIYAAGVLLYELLTGQVPFDGEPVTVMYKALNEAPPTPSVLNGNIPNEIDTVVFRAMAKSRDDRYQSAAEFKSALAAVNLAADRGSTLRWEPPPAQPSAKVPAEHRTPVDPAPRSRKRWAWMLAGASAFAGVLVVFLQTQTGQALLGRHAAPIAPVVSPKVPAVAAAPATANTANALPPPVEMAAASVPTLPGTTAGAVPPASAPAPVLAQAKAKPKNTVPAAARLAKTNDSGAASPIADADVKANPKLHQIFLASQSGDYDKARKMADELVRDHPSGWRAHFVSAQIYAKQGNQAAARKEFQSAEQLDPGLPFAAPHAVANLKAELGLAP